MTRAQMDSEVNRARDALIAEARNQLTRDQQYEFDATGKQVYFKAADQARPELHQFMSSDHGMNVEQLRAHVKDRVVAYLVPLLEEEVKKEIAVARKLLDEYRND